MYFNFHDLRSRQSWKFLWISHFWYNGKTPCPNRLAAILNTRCATKNDRIRVLGDNLIVLISESLVNQDQKTSCTWDIKPIFTENNRAVHLGKIHPIFISKYLGKIIYTQRSLCSKSSRLIWWVIYFARVLKRFQALFVI